ncbi:hypothetical protein [Roseateles violae]|uniref:Uncharacterized protein n=1 Tax=Roseateles violae TaxID=3058042 RepID=A0ABT8E0H6_9BURK|nr:hypothetical protein [Pelomonas sp. PFR6]MDN3921496.1 hypothetical protein [Pelomonas sp. PFR6]MDN3923304.1 hypothetical protein [Pelomonas sp. PFR6]
MRSALITQAQRQAIKRAYSVDAVVGSITLFLGFVGLIFAGMPA